MTTPGVDPGFFRGLEIGLVLTLLIWAAIFVLIYTGWNVA